MNMDFRSKWAAQHRRPTAPNGRAELPLRPNFPEGFTLTELLVVITIITVMAGLFVSAAGSSSNQAMAARCMNNMRRLSMAWRMYADANHNSYPANEEGDMTTVDSGGVNGTTIKVLPWVNGWMNYSGGTAGSDTNIAFLISPRYVALASYVSDPGVFKCPADLSRSFGTTGVPRVRSVSMNTAIGCALDGVMLGIGSCLGGGGTPGPWRIYSKDSDVVAPSPSRLWLLLEEHPDSIDDGAFAVNMNIISDQSAGWVNQPAKYHENGCAFSFVDGHVVMHKWLNPTDIPDPLYGIRTTNYNYPGTFTNTRDLRWVGEHTTARIDGGPYSFTQIPD